MNVKVETLSSHPFALAPNGKPELYGMAAGHDASSAYPGLGVIAPHRPTAATHWPWATELAAASARLATLPVPTS